MTNENDITKFMPGIIGFLGKEPTDMAEIQKSLQQIELHHKKISNEKTPKHEVKTHPHSGFSYVEEAYMRRIANKHFPMWSWTIINRMTHEVEVARRTLIGTPKTEAEIKRGEKNEYEWTQQRREVAFSIHGRLTWVEKNGVVRIGDEVGGHANYLLKDKSDYVSVSNAWKSANTETLKKALNRYMNIADDVYENIDIALSEKERTEMLMIARDITDDEWFFSATGKTFEDLDEEILNGTINMDNLSTKMRQIKKLRKEYYDETGKEYDWKEE